MKLGGGEKNTVQTVMHWGKHKQLAQLQVRFFTGHNHSTVLYTLHCDHVERRVRGESVPFMQLYGLVKTHCGMNHKSLFSATRYALNTLHHIRVLLQQNPGTASLNISALWCRAPVSFSTV